MGLRTPCFLQLRKLVELECLDRSLRNALAGNDVSLRIDVARQQLFREPIWGNGIGLRVDDDRRDRRILLAGHQRKQYREEQDACENGKPEPPSVAKNQEQ